MQNIETELISGSVDGMLIHWKLHLNPVSAALPSPDQWEIVQFMDALADTTSTKSKKTTKKKKRTFKINPLDSIPNSEQSHAITGIAVLSDGKECFVASCSADSNVYIWYRACSQDPFRLIQKLPFSILTTQHCCTMFYCDNGTPILCSGGIDNRVHVHQFERQVADDTDGTSAGAAPGKFMSACQLKGHQDWIRSMRACNFDDHVMLATASQDSRIRLWKIQRHTSDSTESGGDVQVHQLSQQGFIVSIGAERNKYSIMLEALLDGHEEWVHSVDWHPPVPRSRQSAQNSNENNDVTTYEQPEILLSSSMDRTMILWGPNEEVGGIWEPRDKMGEFGGLGGLFGQMGYFTGSFSGNGDHVLATGYHGSFHLWKKVKDEDEETEEEEEYTWVPQVSVSGHFGAVTDCIWNPNDNYFMACSSDQTTRLFAPWIHSNTGKNPYHEIARPQIHGYDIECLTFVPLADREHLIVTGSDEKVLRVFEAPDMFVDSLKAISGIETKEDSSGTRRSRPLGASVPALGLSNKAVLDEGELISKMEKQEGDDVDFIDEVTPQLFSNIQLDNPPFEQHLLQNTLWPEIHKIYGHANEIMCCACNHSGTVLASACKAKQKSEAGIRLWDTRDPNWREIAHHEEGSHLLTVTQIEFSPNDRYMVSVSRDRHMIVYEQQQVDDKITYDPVIRQKGHDRIIWTCSWTHDSTMFATGARDQIVKIWSVVDYRQNQRLTLVHQLPEFKQSVTAVAFANTDASNVDNNKYRYLIAVGLEDGSISLWNAPASDDPSGLKWEQLLEVDNKLTHCEAVKRLRFRTVIPGRSWQLLSCSTDWSVRLFDVELPE